MKVVRSWAVVMALAVVAGSLLHIDAQAAQAAAPNARAWVDSGIGSWPMGGGELTVAAPAEVSASGGLVFVEVGSGYERIRLRLASAEGGQSLEPGHYPDAVHADWSTSVPGRPGLSVGVGLSDCYTEAGQFTIDVLDVSETTVLALAVRFEVQCQYGAKLVGTVAVNADDVYPQRTLSVREVVFEPQLVGTAPTTKRLDIRNDGPGSLEIKSVDLVGADASAFTVDDADCPPELDAGGTCAVEVEFTPTGEPRRLAASLVFVDSLLPLGSTGRFVPISAEVAPPPHPSGEFTAVTPQRLLDTRDGTGRGGLTTKIGPAANVEVDVTGVGELPATGVEAVVVNITATQPSGVTFLTAWPGDGPVPLASNLNVEAGQTRPNLATVPVGNDGTIRIYNNAGTTHIIVDVFGYYASFDGRVGSRFHSLDVPVRMIDTRIRYRIPVSPLGPGQSVAFDVRDYAGLPAGGITAITFNVTITEPSSETFLTLHPDDVARPLVSNLNAAPGQTIANAVTVRVPADGKVRLYNNAGFAQAIVDVVGWYDEDKQAEGGRFVAREPQRVLDTREFDEPLYEDTLGSLAITEAAEIPAFEVDSVVTNLTVTEPTTFGYLGSFPIDLLTLPTTSTLNFTAGETAPNHATIRVSDEPWTIYSDTFPPGTVAFFVPLGHVHLIVDLVGYFTAA